MSLFFMSLNNIINLHCLCESFTTFGPLHQDCEHHEGVDNNLFWFAILSPVPNKVPGTQESHLWDKIMREWNLPKKGNAEHLA